MEPIVQTLLILEPNNLDWLLACLGCRWMIITNVFTDGPVTPDVEQALENSTISACPWEDRGSAVIPPGQLPVILLSNKRFSQTTLGWCEQHKVHFLASTRGFRSLTPSWLRSSSIIDHSAIGGVTSTVASMFWAHQGINAPDLSFESSTPRDLSTVLECGAQAMGPMRIPPECDKLAAVNLGCPSFPVCHGQGLLPPCPTPVTKTVCPSQHIRKGFWGVRTLTFTELRHAHDIGDGMLEFVPQIAKCFTPLGILRCFLQAVASATTRGDSFWFTSKRGADRTEEAECEMASCSPAKRNKLSCDSTAELLPCYDPVSADEKATSICEVYSSEISSRDTQLNGKLTISSAQPVPWECANTTKMSVERNLERSPGAGFPSPTSACSSHGSHRSESSRGSCELPFDSAPNSPEDRPVLSTTSHGCSYEGLHLPELVKRRDSGDEAEVELEVIPFSDDGEVDDEVDFDRVEEMDCGVTNDESNPGTKIDEDPHPSDQSQEKRERKATKSDDAPVPTWLWENHLISDGPTPWSDGQIHHGIGLARAMDVARLHLLRKWKRRTMKSFVVWWGKHHRIKRRQGERFAMRKPDVRWNAELKRYEWDQGLVGRKNFQGWHLKKCQHCKDFQAGRDCLCRTSHSTWWDWSSGSRPMFWRWPSDARADMRDGMMVFFVSPPPQCSKAQQRHANPTTKPLVEKKLQTVIDRGYLDDDQIVASLTSFFPVDKGEDDMRMVCDGTKCGLNDSVWTPSFMMPTLTSHLRAVVEGTHMCDVDIGECFLNFMLHPTLRVLCGIDLGPYDLDFSKVADPSSNHPIHSRAKVWLAWNRAAMGMKWSPYQAVRSMHFAEEAMRGNRQEPGNVFGWDYVRCNFPGQSDCDPALPWVSKVKFQKDGTLVLAADLFTFVDDCRPTGSSSKEAWQAGRRTASIINWLGCQDAPRKRRDSRTDPGAWAGALVRTEGGVFALASDDKWIKFKDQVVELDGMLASCPTALPRKRLEQIRGFLNYVVQTYRPMIPCLNGLHMTVGWTFNSDKLC